MTRIVLSTFAATALLTAAASSVATGKTDASLTPAVDPLPSGNLGRITPAPAPASPDRGAKTAFTYIELLVVKSGGLSKNKKGLRANRQDTNQVRKPARKSR